MRICFTFSNDFIEHAFSLLYDLMDAFLLKEENNLPDLFTSLLAVFDSDDSSCIFLDFFIININ